MENADGGAAMAFPVKPLSGFQILLIEDHHTAREVFAVVLRHSGATVAIASDARAALETLRCFTPDVIVADVRLPDGDAAWVLAQARGRGVSAAFIAVSGGDFDAASLREQGFHAYLTKPVDRGRLVDAILTAACDAGQP